MVLDSLSKETVPPTRETALAAQNFGNPALGRAVCQIGLFQSMLFHQKLQHRTRLRFGNRAMGLLVRLHPIRQTVEHIRQRMGLIIAHGLQQHL